MANVFQIVRNEDASETEMRYFDESLVAESWHASVSVSHPMTLCGIQLEGEDGVMAGPSKSGRVTCAVCRAYLEQVQSIRNWK